MNTTAFEFLGFPLLAIPIATSLLFELLEKAGQ
jgi:hypothetical protein